MRATRRLLSTELSDGLMYEAAASNRWYQRMYDEMRYRTYWNVFGSVMIAGAILVHAEKTSGHERVVFIRGLVYTHELPAHKINSSIAPKKT